MATAACLLTPFLLDGRPPVDSPKKLMVESRALIDLERRLFLAVKSSGNFAQQLVLFLPARLERPGEDLLEMIAVVHRRVEKNPGPFAKKCWALFDSG